MIERLIEFSISHRWLVIAAAAVLAIGGWVAAVNTPTDAIPDLSENQVIVFTEWEGHGPQEIEDQITFPLSTSLQSTPGVRVVRGSSEVNFSMIHVIFQERVGIDQARRDTLQAMARVSSELPPDALPQLAPESPATGHIFWYTVEGANHDLGELRAIQDWYVRPQLASIPGVAEVASVGGFASEYQIEVDPSRLQLLGVRLDRLIAAVRSANSPARGQVLQKGNAEYVVRSLNRLGQDSGATGSGSPENQTIRDLENIVIPIDDRRSVRLAELAQVHLGPAHRRGALERDGNEVTGGVVSMRFGENPLELTRQVKSKVDELQSSLPEGVRIVGVYDRTPLIHGAIHTVTRTLLEAIVAASLCVILVLLHMRASLVIALSLPLATLSAFLAIWVLRWMGIADVQTNIMTLAGIVVSIGVLVDASIVMAENAMFTLHRQFGNEPVRGDTRRLLLPASIMVGRPIFFSILIMLLSFFPVFALDGAAGKMFRPLAITKSAALIAAALLAITLVPALCTLLVRGRIRDERENWLVRTVMDVYRPVLDFFLTNPAPLAWILAVIFVVGFAPLGIQWLLMLTLFAGIVVVAKLARTWLGGIASVASLVVLALIADQNVRPLQHELMTPLAEGMVMDMPITVPLASITQSVDDLKARNMVLCRFPEVSMVVGKVGRAETPTDPAPLDMIETMVDFRVEAFWPRRKLQPDDARRHSRIVLDTLMARKLVAAPTGGNQGREAAAADVAATTLPRFDALMREYAFQRNEEFSRELGTQLTGFAVAQCVREVERNGRLRRPLTEHEATTITASVPKGVSQSMNHGPNSLAMRQIMQHVSESLIRLKIVEAGTDVYAGTSDQLGKSIDHISSLLGRRPLTFAERLHGSTLREHDELWTAHIARLDDELLSRGASTITRLIIEEHLRRQHVLDDRLAAAIRLIDAWRMQPPGPPTRGAAHHASAGSTPPIHDAQPLFHELQQTLAGKLQSKLLLWKARRDELIGFGGELDQALRMPGWVNVWTMPIQNRVDMLSTGVNTTVGVRVLGRNLEEVIAAAEQVGTVIRRVPGASDVVVDPVRGKGYLDIRLNRSAAAEFGVRIADFNQAVEAALGGTLATTTNAGRTRQAVRIRFPRSLYDDEASLMQLPIPARPSTNIAGPANGLAYVRLGDVAEVRTSEGPASIKSENGMLRTYVRCNVRNRGSLDFVEQAKRVVATQAKLPAGVHIEWTGQFESEARARSRLIVLVPAVLMLIALILYATYRDVADAVLVMLALPGAMAGGVFFQWLLGFNFSVTVWIGYIACFGMAAATGIIMLVYLRDAVARAGGVERMNLAELRQAVIDGAVHRLRPKLLTEGTTIIGLAPMLWATGPGADVIRPMAAPVLGGILVADEVIDLLLPVLFYWVRRRRWHTYHAADSLPPLTETVPTDGLVSWKSVQTGVTYQET
jgi:Cu(I)/Ag(I) efflux system membrane protein CusA/SilA